MHGKQGIRLSMTSRDPKLIGFDALSACDRWTEWRKQAKSRAHEEALPSRRSYWTRISEPAISGTQKRKRRCPLAAKTYVPLTRTFANSSLHHSVLCCSVSSYR